MSPLDPGKWLGYKALPISQKGGNRADLNSRNQRKGRMTQRKRAIFTPQVIVERYSGFTPVSFPTHSNKVRQLAIA